MTRSFLILLLLLGLIATGPLFALSPGDAVSISVREGELRSAPQFLAAITQRLGYGVSVTVEEIRQDWARIVLQDGVRGWIHTTSIAPPEEMNLTGTQSESPGTTPREIALAGRGFNEQVEAEYRSQNELNFDRVDRMEGYLAPLEDLGAFLQEIDAELSGEVDS